MAVNSIFLWVLLLVTPVGMPDIPVSPPMMTFEECKTAGDAYPEAPFDLMCRMIEIYWADLA